MDDHRVPISTHNPSEVSASPLDADREPAQLEEMESSKVCSAVVSVDQTFSSSVEEAMDTKHLTSVGDTNGKAVGELQGLENPAYETDSPVAKKTRHEYLPPPSPTKDEVAVLDSGLHGAEHDNTPSRRYSSTEIQTPLSVKRNESALSIPSSSSDDVSIELCQLDNPPYGVETPTVPDDSAECQTSEGTSGSFEQEYDVPASFTTPSSISDDLAIDLSGLDSPAHGTGPVSSSFSSPSSPMEDNNSDNTSTPTALPEETIRIEMEEVVESLKKSGDEKEEDDPSNKVASSTVITAVVVESAEEKSTTELEQEERSLSPPYSSSSTPLSAGGVIVEKTGLVDTVASNTMLLASGDSLPSLPPPHVFPSDETKAQQILINDTLDKAALAELEMKILQKTESANSPPGAERCDSQLSSLSDKLDICRICHCEGEENNKLISPCLCSGSLKYLHLACLQKWIKSSDKKACELCNFDYVMSSKTRPFKEWEKLEMTHTERRKVVCSVTFHIIAITCVIWSLYVLIDRTTEEVHLGTLDWPFWTKLIVVAIGFTGGMIFMYVQCKMYVHLCVRWRAFNKLIFVENAPEDPQLRAEAAARIKDKAHEEGGMVNPVALQELDAV